MKNDSVKLVKRHGLCSANTPLSLPEDVAGICHFDDVLSSRDTFSPRSVEYHLCLSPGDCCKSALKLLSYRSISLLEFCLENFIVILLWVLYNINMLS